MHHLYDFTSSGVLHRPFASCLAVAMDAFTPQQTTELVSRIGAKKSHMRLDKLWWNSFMAGPLLGFG